MARFVERWSQLTIHPFVGAAVLMDIHDRLAPADQVHFRTTREARFSASRWKRCQPGATKGSPHSGNRLNRCARHSACSPYLGGQQPLFGDYIVAGAFQWARVVSPFRLLEEDDRIADWIRALCLSPAWRARRKRCGGIAPSQLRDAPV